jgi:hypothetical protein
MNTSKASRRQFSELIIKNQNSSKSNRTIIEDNGKKEFETELNRIALSYYQYKLKHNGITSFKTFENCNRKMKFNSLCNLRNYNMFDYSEFNDGFNGFDSSDKKAMNSMLSYLQFEKEKENKRNLCEKQVRAIKNACNKLSYYSKERIFMSKKTGKYKFKTAFLTLTAPETASNIQILAAFEHFLDYLRRTALCNYVWKKELGKKSKMLHFHIMINNFIPFYIVSWKWKRLLMNEGVIWPVNDLGKQTESHYRIELPRNSKIASSYIAKYMSKGDEMEIESIDPITNKIYKTGYLWGQSKQLKDLKEIAITEDMFETEEMFTLINKYKLVVKDFVSHLCVDIMKVKLIAPSIFGYFEKQFYSFQELLSLPQKFQYV